jgi:hypothetical protein
LEQTGQLTYVDDLLGKTSKQIAYQGMPWEDSDKHGRQPAYWLVKLHLVASIAALSADSPIG